MSDSFNPSQWICRKDPRTQRTYYVNRRTGRSTWDPTHRTAVDTEPVAALYQAVVPVVDVSAASLTVVDPRGTAAAPQCVAVPSSSALVAPLPERQGVGAVAPAVRGPMPKKDSGLSPAVSPSSGSDVPSQERQAAQRAPDEVPKLTLLPIQSGAFFHVPRSSPTSLAASPDLKQATPLGTSPVLPIGSPTTPNAVASPTEPTVTTESSASISSTQTQRPSDSGSGAQLNSSSSTIVPHLPGPPPLPLPSLVSQPAAAAPLTERSGNEADGAFTLQQHGVQQDRNAAVDLEAAAAAEEWRLTQRTWELEGERARLESELAVLRGPVEVETQSIAEEHSRLLEAQQALETAAALAVRQQQTKRAELEGLRRRLSELQDQRTTSRFLHATLQSRLAVVTERCRAVEAEETQLRGQRAEMENVALPAEEAALRAAQDRLAEQRQRVAAQQQHLEDRQRSLARAREEVQRLKHRVEELTAFRLSEEGGAHKDTEGTWTATSLAHRESTISRENTPPSRGGADAGTLAVAVGSKASPSHAPQLQLRVEELRRDVAAIQSAHRALFESEVLAGQQEVLTAWTQRVRGEAETWQGTLDDAAATLKELASYYKTQFCKYERRGGATATTATR